MEIIIGLLILYLAYLALVHIVWPVIVFAWEVFKIGTRISLVIAGIIAAVGVIYGLLNSVYNYLDAISEVYAKVRKPRTGKGKKAQPAFINYFFGQSYHDLKEVIITAWQNNGKKIEELSDEISYPFSKDDYGKGIVCLVFYGPQVIMLAVVGSLFSLSLTIVHCAILFVITFIVYVTAAIVWSIDKIYLSSNGIFGACPHCKNKYKIPIYICKSCGVEHTKLSPGKYGVFYRKCQCGDRLPSSVITRRRSLEAKCPICSRSLTNEAGVQESVPICIPVIGGRSVGKTCYLAAVIRELIEDIGANEKVDITFYNEENRIECERMINKYNNGFIQDQTTDYNPSAYNLYIKPPKGIERLLYLYDIAGEAFAATGGLVSQVQYEYSSGFIFVIDPLSIPNVREKYNKTDNFDEFGASLVDTNDTFDMFMLNLQKIANMNARELSNVPCAIVINKVDAYGLDKIFGRGAVNAMLNKEENANREFGELMDEKIREYLKQNGMHNFLNNIDTSFKKTRFFAVSSLGHNQDGTKFRSVLTMAPFAWIVCQSDSALRNVFKKYAP